MYVGDFYIRFSLRCVFGAQVWIKNSNRKKRKMIKGFSCVAVVQFDVCDLSY